MSENELRKSGDFVIYISEYVSSMPNSVISRASIPNSVADLTANRTTIIPPIVPKVVSPVTTSYPQQTYQPMFIENELLGEFAQWDALSDEVILDQDL